MFRLPQFTSPCLLLAAAWLCTPNPAKADWSSDAIQVSCSQNLHYFSLRTIEIDDERANEQDQQESGIYDILGPLNHPITCNLATPASRMISVSVEDYNASHERGECAAMASFSISIKVNGKEVRRFSAFGMNRCLNGETHLIELNSFDILKDCTIPDAPYPFHGPATSTANTSCTAEKITSP
jgi:hypothetical protein